MDVNIQGTIPDQQDGAQVSYKDADIEFNKNNKAGSISSRGQLIASVNNVEQIIDIDQQVCPSASQKSTKNINKISFQI